jgi:hypothetical protein
MKNLYLLLGFFIANYGFGQTLKLNFDENDNRDNWETIIAPKGLSIIDGSGTSGKGLNIVTGKSFSTVDLGNFNPKSISFSVSIYIEQGTTQFQAQLEVSRDGTNWISLWVKSSTLNTDYTSENVTVTDLGIRYIRWRVDSFDSPGAFYIDDIEIIAYSENDKASKNAQLSDEELSKTIEAKVGELTRNNQRREAETLIADLKRTYKKHLFILRNVYNKTVGIEITEKTGDLIFTRSKMANPTSYNEFDGWIEKIEEITPGNSVLHQRVNDIKEQMKEKLKSKAGGVLNFIGQVGNIVTGGRLNGLIGSFKNIFSMAFGKNNLENNYPSLTRQSNGKMQESSNNIEKVQTTIAEGLDEYKRLTSFFNVISKENEILVKQAALWNSESHELASFRKNINEFTRKYILLTSSTTPDKSVMANFFKGDEQTMNNLEADIDLYFNGFIGNRRFTGFSSEQKNNIRKINNDIDDIDDIVDKYYSYARSFLRLYGDMEIDLKRPNPFVRYSVFDGAEGAVEKWDNLKQSALPLSTEIKELVRDNYVDHNVRYVPGYNNVLE